MADYIRTPRSQLEDLAAQYGTPLYVYDRKWLAERAKLLLNICRRHGFLARYAAKANSHPEIVKLFEGLGLHFDASSEFEAWHLLDLGVEPERVSLSSQQPPQNMKVALNKGVLLVATSLHQLDLVKKSGYGSRLAVRLNPGIGSGHSRRTTTGGVSSSFGIWHEYLPEVLRSGLEIDRIQIHVGAGVDTKIWREVIQRALELVEQVPMVRTLNIGGGYKVGRIAGEKDADMSAICGVFAEELDDFKKRTGRDISLELEPGTWLVAGGGLLLSRVIDIVDTGPDGFNFIKLDTGMNDFLRPTLYGAQHQIEVLNDVAQKNDYIVVGHNCESGDILTPEPGKPEILRPRRLNKAGIGDLVSISSVGAYGASLRAIGYNSFPEAAEILI